MAQGPNILIPCKSLAHGKSRLSTILDTVARKTLCRELLLNTLDITREAFLPSQIFVVTSDPEVRAIATEYGFTAFLDVDGGLNPAIAFARDMILSQAHPNQALMILPTDLPLLSVAALEEILKQEGDVVIVPDAQWSGTNVVLLRGRAKEAFSFSFGECSLQRHRRIADRQGLRINVTPHPVLSFDLDRSGDYERLRGLRDFCAWN